MRTVAMFASALLVLALQTRPAAAACDGDDVDPDACAEELASFDEEFNQDVSLVDTIKLAVGDRMLKGVVVHWSDDDDDDGYIESEEELEFGDGFDGIDDGTDGDATEIDSTDTDSTEIDVDVDTETDIDTDTDLDD